MSSKHFIFIWLTLAVIPYTKQQTVQQAPVVKIKNGLIRGKYGFTFDKRTPYSRFIGIPFAQPPIGDLRFAVSFF